MKEKVLMFGEGNFLRGFAAVAIQRLNDNAGFDGSIVCLQGMEKGLSDIINAQNGSYTVIERGVENGQVVDRGEKIHSISRCVDPYSDYAGYLQIAKNPDLQIVISNTTEFGIYYDEAEKSGQTIYKNFPAKLTDFLFKRFKHFDGAKDKGLLILPCELIEHNGKALKEIVLRYASNWGLGSEFSSWLGTANVFCNTLVDRIVSGYPHNEAQSICDKLGYKDNLLDVCEPFFLWVIETDDERIKNFHFDKCGLDIIITNNLLPYRQRKVRILNGAHTMSVLAGHLSGLDTVEQLVNDSVFLEYIRKGIFEEIIPSFGGDRLELYANNVMERFRNPFLNHKLLSISLNSISKFKERVLPSIKDYLNKFGKAPTILSFSFAALYVFYKSGIDSFVKDDAKVVESVKSCTDIKEFLGNVSLWGEDLNALNGLYDVVNFAYRNISKKGIKLAAEQLVSGQNLYVISDLDNVGTSLTDNFKYALSDIAKGNKVVKYGFPIGIATHNIKMGDRVHTDNMKSGLNGKCDYKDGHINGINNTKVKSDLTFEGFVRHNGSVGIRNDIYIIPTVGCVNGLCQRIADECRVNSEAIKVFTHPYGCSQLGGDHENTKKILKGLALHPNAGGVLIVSLGCENNSMEAFREFLGEYDTSRVRFMTAQASGDEFMQGVRNVLDLIDIASKDQRATVNIDKLKIGIKCGGSDAFSGITANPLLGRISDKLTTVGGSVIMSEVPEMFGAEHILMSRAADKETYDKIAAMVNNFKQYFISHGESVGENPSPGNKEGGITTLEEKSLGCVQKAGTAPVVSVLEYGQNGDRNGLILLDGPGNDIVACTALAAAGAQLILFTTGRGTPLGSPVPVVKVSSNTALAQKKPLWIDYNAGILLEGQSMEQSAAELIELILSTANGQQTKNERNNYHDFAIWKGGVTL